MELTTPRFALLPLFLLAATFSLLSPLYWTHVEMPDSPPAGTPHENQEIYGRLMPALHYGYGRMGAGEWPLWSPRQFCGMPFFANPIHGLFQPLNLVFFFTPLPQGLALHAFLGLFLMGVLFSLYLRAMAVAYIPAAIGGIVYAFGGATAAVMSRPEFLGVLAWAPLLYWIVFEYGQRPRPLLVLLGGMAMAAMVLGGALMLAGVMALAAFGYGVARILAPGPRRDRGRLRPLRGLLAMAGLGLVFSAVQWVPSAMWMMTLDKPASALWPGGWAGHLPGTLGGVPAAMLVSRTSVLPGMLYIGVIPLMLIPAALLHRQRHFEVFCALAAAAGFLGIAVWGSDGAPGADHWKLLVFPGIAALAVLAGFGADRILLAGRDPRSPLIWGAVLLVLLAAFALLLVGTAETRGPVAMAVLVLLPFFMMRVRWLGVACGLCIALFHFVDLRNASANLYPHPYAAGPDWMGDSLPAIREAEAQALGGRLLALPASRETVLPANIGLLHAVPNAGGAYWPLTREQSLWWSKLTPCLASSKPRTNEVGVEPEPFYPALLNYMDARVVIGERNLPWMDDPAAGSPLQLRYLQTIGRLSLWRNETALARARWVPQWQPVSGIAEATEVLLAPDFPGKSSCTVEANGRAYERLNRSLPPGLSGEAAAILDEALVAIVEESPEEVVISVDAPAEGILLLSDSYDSGWRAYVDGARTPILRANGLFRGVQTAAGQHTVVFRYAPWSATIGLLVTGAGVLLSLAWCLRLAVKSVYRAFRGPVRGTADLETANTRDAIREFSP